MKIKKIGLTLIIFLLITLMFTVTKVEAVEIPENITQEEIVENLPENLENITNEDILAIYDQITEEYSNDEIADMLMENRTQIAGEAGISEDVISAGAEFIRNTDQEEIRNIIENDENINQIRRSLQNGDTPGEAVEKAITNTSASQKIDLVIKVLLANTVVKTVLWVILILFIYCTITRWIIYKKAGKNGFAAIIPFYRQVTMYKVCGLSPFLMLLWLVPIFGWIAMFIIAIMKRILLAENFGRSALFGFGLLLFPPIFQSILAFNKNIEYEGE